MLPPSIVVRLAENVRTCRAHLDEAEATAGEIRAEYHGYLELLTYAESQSEQVAPPIEPDEQPPAGVLIDGVAARGPGWCFCGLPGTPGMVHDTDRCTFAVALDERPRGLGWQDTNWCFCGLPDTSNVAHGITQCMPAKPDPMPAPPAAGSLAAFRRGFFAPHIPANTGTDVPA